MTTPVYSFEDNFDGPAGSPPDPSKWSYETGRWTDNDELETYTDSRANSFLDGDSNLIIRATRKRGLLGRPQYYSARLVTQGLFSQYRGHFEARIKVNSQLGLWPAWWALGNSIDTVGWPQCGEIDFLESYGWGDPSVETSVHTPVSPVPDQDIHTVSKDLPGHSTFHVYRMDWEPDSLTFSRDNVPYLTVTPAQIPNWCFDSGDPMFMILNLAVGGTGGGSPKGTVFPVDMLVDWVRVWR